MKILISSVFEKWFVKLRDHRAKAAIEVRLRNIVLNNSIVGDYKYLGKSIIELRFDIGAGYRIYATQIESELIVLLAGGTKSRQQADIEKAKKIAEEWRQKHESNL